MHQRCGNPKSTHYARYGGRGIRVDPRWASFDSFVADMGHCPSELTLERIDNSKGYNAANCRWATRKEQSRNMSRNRMVTHSSKTRSIVEWSEQTGIAAHVIAWRLRHGWDTNQIFTTPVSKKNSLYRKAFIAGKSRRELDQVSPS